MSQQSDTQRSDDDKMNDDDQSPTTGATSGSTTSTQPAIAGHRTSNSSCSSFDEPVDRNQEMHVESPVTLKKSKLHQDGSSHSNISSNDSPQAAQLETRIVPENDPHKLRRTLTEISSTPDSLPHLIVDKYQLLRYQCGMIVNHPKMQLFIVALIAINAIMMGVATFDFVNNNPRVNHAFDIVDEVFLIIFTVELGMQFIYYGWRLLLDGWLVFDLVIILTSWSFQSVQIVRAFRIFRALRLITRIKVMKNLVLALFGVMPRMFAIGLLLFLVSYIFAVMFTELFQDLYAEGYLADNYFGRLDDTFFTLFQIMTLDNWSDIAREVMAVYSWAWLPFVVFVIVTAFVVVNLIIAVICDAISALHEDDKAKLHGTFEAEEGDTDSASDMHPGLHQDMRAQLDALEEHVDELLRMQEETMITLHTLAQFIANKRRKKTKRRSSSGSRRTSEPQVEVDQS